MDLFLFHPERWEELYNCSMYSVSDIPDSQRQQAFLGAVIIICYVLYMILYLPCIFIILSTDLIRITSYRLMVLLGFFHIVGLQASGLFSGVYAIQGDMFCSRPSMIYTTGAIGLATWVGSTSTTMILGLNRCCELYGRQFAERLFGGFRVFFWMCGPLSVATYAFFYTPPPLFNSILMAAFFNPHVGYGEAAAVAARNPFYENPLHAANNVFVCCSESCIYAGLILLYFRATRYASPEVRSALRKDKKVYVQVVMVGFVHFTAGTIYVLMQFVPVTLYATLTASTFYLLSQGLPPVIYLTVNRTMRAMVLNMLGANGSGQTFTVGSLGVGSSETAAKVTSAKRMSDSVHKRGSG